LASLVLLYQQAWAAPLPVALKTACAYLTARAHAAQSKTPQFQHERGWQAARMAFTGQREVRGECQTSPYVQRAFPAFDDLDADRFCELAQLLYGPMQQACMTQQPTSEQATA
jgi:exonuclease V gamma subunit